MLDETGCQNFPSTEPWNTSLEHAPVDPNSAAYIGNASRYAGGGMTVEGPYTFAIVPAGQPLVTIAGSPHAVPAFPIPTNGANVLQVGGDRNLMLIEMGSPCVAWEASAVSANPWRAYSGGPASMGEMIAGHICVGEQSACGLLTIGNITTWEANHGATSPILHTIHMESPDGLTCDSTPAGVACIPVGGRIRLHAGYGCPVDPNAAAVCVAFKRFGGDVSDNGGTWGPYFSDNYASRLPIPSSVRSFLSGLRVTDFDVVDPPYHCIGQQCGYIGAGRKLGNYPP